MADPDQVVIILRHCQTHLNATGRYQSTSDPRLDEVGREHAEHIGTTLQGFDLAAVVASPSARANETARIILEAAGLGDAGIPIDQDARLAELDVGPFEGQTPQELATGSLKEAHAAWRSIRDHRTPPGVEGLAAVADRAAEVVAELGPGGSLLVGHSFTSRILLAKLLGMPLERHRLLKLDLGHMAVLVRKGGWLRLVQMNVDSGEYLHRGL